MNYEEKYNEILEWARKNKARLNGVPIEEVLPELTESEDERIRKAIIHYILYETKGTISEATEHTWVKWLEKQKERKPAEWSEEDEENLEKVIWYIEKGCKLIFQKPDKLISWLKSLRPSWKPSKVCYGPTGDPDPAGVWKPSEEQMMALLNTLHPDDPYYHDLKSLYEQLKKL